MRGGDSGPQGLLVISLPHISNGRHKGRMVTDCSSSPPRRHPPDYRGGGGKKKSSGLIGGQFAARTSKDVKDKW